MSLAAQPLDIACDDATALQQQLNALYSYQHDLSTKIYHRSRIVLFQRLMRQLIAQGYIRNKRAALDIGCNAGFYSKMISDFGFQNVLGVDIVPEYVARASAAFHSEIPGKSISFETTDATLLPLDHSYDFILCTEVIEHTSTPDVVIRSIMCLLNPGGVAIISLPNALSLGYFTSYFAARLRGRAVSPELLDHLKYPFFKGPALFRQRSGRIIAAASVNVLFNDHMLMWASRMPFFHRLNRWNFWLSRQWPFRCLGQFYFFAISKQGQKNAHKNGNDTIR
jgi:2-polyprenyl-3-methyl-5-hydroxy-6-metoxy-1,4-benzoquinol methylase